MKKPILLIFATLLFVATLGFLRMKHSAIFAEPQNHSLDTVGRAMLKEVPPPPPRDESVDTDMNLDCGPHFKKDANVASLVNKIHRDTTYIHVFSWGCAGGGGGTNRFYLDKGNAEYVFEGGGLDGFAWELAIKDVYRIKKGVFEEAYARFEQSLDEISEGECTTSTDIFISIPKLHYRIQVKHSSCSWGGLGEFMKTVRNGKKVKAY